MRSVHNIENKKEVFLKKGKAPKKMTKKEEKSMKKEKTLWEYIWDNIFNGPLKDSLLLER